MIEKFYCPARAFDCPYYTNRGECTCPNPTEECDDAAALAEEEIEFVLLEAVD